MWQGILPGVLASLSDNVKTSADAIQACAGAEEQVTQGQLSTGKSSTLPACTVVGSESLPACHPRTFTLLCETALPGLWWEWAWRARLLLFSMQGRVSHALQVGVCKDVTWSW